MERSEAIDKVRKLRQMVEMGTPNEQETARILMCKLIGKFKLTTEELYEADEIAAHLQASKRKASNSPAKLSCGLKAIRQRLTTRKYRFNTNSSIVNSGWIDRMVAIEIELDKLIFDIDCATRQIPQQTGAQGRKKPRKKAPTLHKMQRMYL